MDQLFTNDSHMPKVSVLKAEIKQLKANISYLEEKIEQIQFQCKHVFLEVEGFRRCTKCQKVDVYHY
ncbi:hypothetical protein ACFYKX_06330 [Cytobacillus sp. FJAT-54145]|uniref:Serine protease n=1 Tax=Cytobacillus spartinae TaxID=3299023 RepID=A0ABW6K7U0_9BACI